LKEVNKVILFSYPSQTFAAYENGQLVRTGPTNMGREKIKLQLVCFFTNWKAEETTSTFNDEWDLKWNFNIANKLELVFISIVCRVIPLRILVCDYKSEMLAI
jgi:hypothetical protein